MGGNLYNNRFKTEISSMSASIESSLPMETVGSAPSDSQEKHYSNVKMKYFASIGVGSKAVPPQPSDPSLQIKKVRTQTTPESVMFQFEDDDEFSKRKGRSSSTPSAPIQMSNSPIVPVPTIPGSYQGHSQYESDDEERDEFIPPHELAQRRKGFEVGTARSVAIWEQKRRNQHNF